MNKMNGHHHGHYGRNGHGQNGDVNEHSQHSQHSHVRVISHVNHLAVSTGSLFPENISFHPSRPVHEQSGFDRWMTAQMERARGEQPQICVSNGVFLNNLQRVRAPTTQRSLQKKIDLKFHPNALAAGDWSDDEEEDVEFQFESVSSRDSIDFFQFFLCSKI